MPSKLPLARAIRKGLTARADPRRAAGMRAYLKARLPCYGIMAPVIREVTTIALADHPIRTPAAWRLAISTIWDQATHHEERFSALTVAAHRPYQQYLSMAVLPLFRRLIREGAWWDTVDSLAGRVGDLLTRFPTRMKPILRQWARHDDMWLRRVSIIAQVGFRTSTDIPLLRHNIEPSLGSTEFFLRKAIGWALREYAKTDPAAVRRYLREQESRLSNLSRREAIKGFAYVKRHGRLL
jgi:3-methyladenine DNA glycosylase AlkD